jgi:O-acetyl-ADP-ribose deacetylase (regulator of RNase III)
MKHLLQDITSVEDGLVIHGVNCLGVMGSGVALAIRKKWPQVYNSYKTIPTGGESLGVTQIVTVSPDLYVANCFTQLNFGSDGKRYADLDSVDKCLNECFDFAQLSNLHLRTPKIASDRGGLNWESEVKPLFDKYMKMYTNVEVTLYTI